MNKALLIFLLFAAFYLHSRFVFSEFKLQKWVTDYSYRAMSGDSKACDDFSDDTEVKITSQDTEFEGGKEDVCGYMKRTAAAMTVLQANTQSTFDNFQIQRDGFPWLTAKVTYTEHTSIQAQNIPSMNGISNDELIVKRTLGGLQIKSLTSVGAME